MLRVHPSLPAKSVSQLVALSKEGPGISNYGVGGTAGQLRMEMLKINTGMIITNLPYKGLGPRWSIVAGLSTRIFQPCRTAPMFNRTAAGLFVSGTRRSERCSEVPTAGRPA